MGEGRRLVFEPGRHGFRPPWAVGPARRWFPWLRDWLRAALRQRRRCAIGRERGPIRSATGNRRHGELHPPDRDAYERPELEQLEPDRAAGSLGELGVREPDA